MNWFVGSLFCSIGLYVCFYTNTVWFKYGSSVIHSWNQDAWWHQLCTFAQDIFGYLKSSLASHKFRIFFLLKKKQCYLISIALSFLLPWIVQKFYQRQIKSAFAYHLTPVRLLLKKKNVQTWQSQNTRNKMISGCQRFRSRRIKRQSTEDF